MNCTEKAIAEAEDEPEKADPTEEQRPEEGNQ